MTRFITTRFTTTRFALRRSAGPALLAVALGLAGCAGTPEFGAARRGDVERGDLAPIARDYRASALAWARGFYRREVALQDARISDPVPARDSRGRLLWLVCLDVTAQDAAGRPLPRLQALGFAPNWVSTPLARGGATLTREDCDRTDLVWRPLTSVARR